MAITQAHLDALLEAYASGTLSVGHGDQRVQFASGADMWLAIRRLAAILGVSLPGTQARRTFASYRRSRQ